MALHVSEKVRKQKPIQTIPSFGCDDIRAGERVWANDKLSENNVQSGRFTPPPPVTGVTNTRLPLTSRPQRDTHVYRCFTAGTDEDAETHVIYQ